MTIEEVEREGVEQFLGQVEQDLKARKYRLQLVQCASLSALHMRAQESVRPHELILGPMNKASLIRSQIQLVQQLIHVGFPRADQVDALVRFQLPRDPSAGLLFQDADWANSRLVIPGYIDV